LNVRTADCELGNGTLAEECGMKIEEFKAVLKRLEQLYLAAGATGPAKDLQSITRLLEGHEGKSLDEFIAETIAVLAGPSEPEKKIDVNDQQRVAVHAQRLLDAGTNESAFQAALEALDQDRGLRKVDWIAIANKYRNAPTGATYSYKFDSIKDARASISDVFTERFESESKRGIISRIMNR
jgi:hypothetical protein